MTELDTRKEMIDLGRGGGNCLMLLFRAGLLIFAVPSSLFFFLRLYRKNYTECDGCVLGSNEFFDGRDYKPPIKRTKP